MTNLLAEAGRAFEAFHGCAVRGARTQPVQYDELWSFTHAKTKNVASVKAAPEQAGALS